MKVILMLDADNGEVENIFKNEKALDNFCKEYGFKKGNSHLWYNEKLMYNILWVDVITD